MVGRVFLTAVADTYKGVSGVEFSVSMGGLVCFDFNFVCVKAAKINEII